MAAQELYGAHRTVFHTSECDRDQRDDDQCVEYDRGEYRALRGGELHDIERVQCRVRRRKRGGDDGEVLRHIVGDAERRQCAARHQELLSDLNDLHELRRVAVQIDHVRSLARGLGPRVHRDGNVRLRERGGVVCAIPGHGDEAASLLIFAYKPELVFGLRFREEVVDPGFRRNRRRGELVITGDHDGPYPHQTKLRESLFDSSLDNILQVYDAEDFRILGNNERGPPGPADVLDGLQDRRRECPPFRFHKGADGFGGALPYDPPEGWIVRLYVGPAHARLRAERNKVRCDLTDLPAAEAVLLLGKDGNGPPFGGLVRQGGKLRRIRKAFLRYAGSGSEFRRHAVSERHRPCLVKKEDVDVSGRLDGAS